MDKIDLRKLGDLSQVCFVKEYNLSSGKARGARILDVNNGVMRFNVLADNCLDIGEMSYKGLNYSFISKTGLTNSLGKGYTSLVDNFGGGLIYTCGLDATGDVENKRTHGSIHWTPAEKINIKCDENGIEISGEIIDGALFNQSVAVRRTIKTAAFSNELTVTDEIINRAYTDFEYRLLYHINFGWPLLDENTVIQADFGSTEPITQHAAKYIADIYKAEKPEDGLFEKVYYHNPKKGDIAIYNTKNNMKARVIYDNIMLPELVEWKSMTSGDYALGIEPATTKFKDRAVCKKLKPGEKHVYDLKLIFD